MRRWFEHFFVLPIRWFRIHRKNWTMLKQRCKVCGHGDKFEYWMQDDTWYKVVPPKYQDRVVCLTCFDGFAKEKEIDYSTSIELLCFAGDKVSFDFEIISSGVSKTDKE